MFALVIITLFFLIAELFMERFALGAILLPAAVGQERLSAPDAILPYGAFHFFIPKQFSPHDPVQFRVDRQDTFQKIVTADGSIMNGRKTGIDYSTIVFIYAFP